MSYEKNGVYHSVNADDADFGELDISGADFTGSSLRCAEFYATTAIGAIFRNCDMTEAGFDAGADLSRADFRGANLTDACFMGQTTAGALYDDDTIFPSGFDPNDYGFVKQ